MGGLKLKLFSLDLLKLGLKSPCEKGGLKENFKEDFIKKNIEIIIPNEIIMYKIIFLFSKNCGINTK